MISLRRAISIHNSAPSPRLRCCPIHEDDTDSKYDRTVHHVKQPGQQDGDLVSELDIDEIVPSGSRLSIPMMLHPFPESLRAIFESE